MRLVVPLVAPLLVVSILAQSASGAELARPRVTLFGDSVAGALAYHGKARTTLAKGLDLRVDAKVCRRLAEPGCPYLGDRPPSVLSLVDKPAQPLGDVVVVDVGYNDDPSAYEDGIDRVMQALARQRVATVIWVTMQDKRALYRTTNAAIRAAARRWPQIVVADWSAESRARAAWFVDDGLHLSTAGALGLAKFLRPLVLASSCTASCMRERRIVDTGNA